MIVIRWIAMIPAAILIAVLAFRILHAVLGLLSFNYGPLEMLAIAFMSFISTFVYFVTAMFTAPIQTKLTKLVVMGPLIFVNLIYWFIIPDVIVDPEFSPLLLKGYVLPFKDQYMIHIGLVLVATLILLFIPASDFEK